MTREKAIEVLAERMEWKLERGALNNWWILPDGSIELHPEKLISSRDALAPVLAKLTDREAAYLELSLRHLTEDRLGAIMLPPETICVAQAIEEARR